MPPYRQDPGSRHSGHGNPERFRYKGVPRALLLVLGLTFAAAADEVVLRSGGRISCEVLDLRSLRPLDRQSVLESVRKTSRLLVVDEDYREYGLSGELAATVLEAGLGPNFSRVCVEATLPYNREEETAALPNADRITEAARDLMRGPPEG